MTTNKTPQPSIDFGYPTPAEGPVPAFNSIEEEAEFWDTHNFTDFSELTEADFDEEVSTIAHTAGSERSEELPVRLAPKDRDELDRRAEEMGVEPSTLVRRWIEERLRKEAS